MTALDKDSLTVNANNKTKIHRKKSELVEERVGGIRMMVPQQVSREVAAHKVMRLRVLVLFVQ